MARDWLEERRPPNVDELVADEKYAQAAAVLRAEIKGRRGAAMPRPRSRS